MLKNRVYYWGTVVPLTAMLLYVHAEYRDQQAIIERQYTVSNRQFEIMGASYVRMLNAQSKRHDEELTKIMQHNGEEVREIIEHSQLMLEEAKI